ncbi:MAG: hypothetical protein SynsKO_11710 [Synoicihabitans sp.]
MQRLFKSITLFLLIGSTALQADVQWQAWSDGVAELASQSEQPIYLFVADPLSELSTSMDNDSFSNAEVAAFLNENFICVRTTRHEVPGIGAFGQQWLAADQKIPGWPLNLWLTPQLEPIEAASYLPPTEEWGREGFMVVASRVAEKWSSNANAVSQAAARRVDLIADYLPFAADGVGDLDAALADAAERWLALLNAETGTFGDPLHNAEPELLRFLIARGGAAQEAALQALKIRLSSPLRDPVDGGIFRATIDNAGRMPLFQKRLTDQARFALACLDAAQVSEDPIYAAGAKSALDYAINRLSPGDGTFLIGENATLDPTRFRQVWTWDEITSRLGEKLARRLGATPAGNVDPADDAEGKFEGFNVLQIPLTEADSAVMRTASLALQTIRYRQGDARVHLQADAAVHGLMLHALNRSTTELGDLDHGGYLLGTQSALRRDFGAQSEFFSHLSRTEIPPLANDYFLVSLGLNDPELVTAADEQFYDDEFGLYYATVDDVFGARPLQWPPSGDSMPGPASWRVMLGDAPEYLVTELTAAFDNPDVPPPGHVLLALQQSLSSE